MDVTVEEFEVAVADALDSIPAELAALMDNVVVLIEPEPPADEASDLLGLYDGIPLTERGSDYRYGAAALFLLDRSLPHLHPEFPDEAAPEGPRVRWRRPVLLFIAITVHNIPEGLAVGVAYGGASVAAATCTTPRLVAVARPSEPPTDSGLPVVTAGMV